MMPKSLYLLPGVMLALLLASCGPSKKSIVDYRYFERNLDSLAGVVVKLQEPVIQRHDQLSITVSSATLNQEQAEVFNLMQAAGGAGGAGGGGAAGGGVMGYLVDYDGTLTFPVLGKVPAAGLTKSAFTDTLLKRMEPYVRNPVVNVRFLNYRVMMMGEVGQKGWITFNNEKATVVDAIAQAGGLSEQGLRDSILLIRQQPDGKMETHRLNMNDALVYQSPYFQLQQNDIIYVLPNESKLIQYERANSPFFRDLPVYMGLITSILAFITLIVSLTN